MREIIARLVALFTLCVVIVLSLLFAWAHNPPQESQRGKPAKASAPALVRETPRPPVSIRHESPVRKPAVETVTPEEIERGRAVYEQQKCATCHSIAGVGNPRNPLDGVGAKWSASEMVAWITGTGSAADVLPAGIAKRKQRYRSIPADELTALVAYLLTLQPSR